MFRECLAVALGGMCGALGRFALMGLFTLVGPSWWPLATLTANVLGCLAIGWLAQWTFHHELTHHWLVVGVRVGLLGGLTTFSSFALDIYRLWQSGRSGLTLALLLAHVILGLCAVVLGMSLARQPSAG